MMAATNYRNQQQPLATGDDISPRRGAAGLHPQQPTRIKSFFRQNQNSHALKILLPLLYLSLAALYFYNLLLRDVGSGVDVLRDNIDENITYASAPIWNSDQSDAAAAATAKLEPRSLADVAIANAEVSWKRKAEYEEYLLERARIREERRKAIQESLAKMQKASNSSVAHAEGQPDAIATTERTELIRLPRPDNSSETPEEYVKRLTNLRAPNKRGHKMGQHSSSQQQDLGLLQVFVVMFVCTIFRVLLSLVIGHMADDNLESALDDADADDERNATAANDADDDDAPSGRNHRGRRRYASLSSFVSDLSSGGREAARLRRRARAVRARRQFQRFVDRLNAERTSNGERRIEADTLRHLMNGRDFDGNDYDRLSTFVEENGPASGSIFSYIGATEAEIGRCPSRTLGGDDELLGARRGAGEPQTCSVCLEPYQIGETVRTIPCFHTFHTGCIDPWLAQRAECPVCKHSAIG